MTITGIRPYEKGKNRVAIFLNDEFAFVLYRGELSKYKLEEGMELTDSVYDQIMSETLYKRARLRGMNLLMNRDRTEHDLRTKLSEGGYPQEVIEDAIEYLKSYHYIDDNRYASEYIRFKSQSMSKREIHRKLREKGISDDIIERELLSDENDSEYDVLLRLMSKKCPNGSELDKNGRNKLFAYFYRKGFSIELIEKCFSNLT